MTEILVLFYSRYGATAELARQVARGIEGVDGATARLRTVPPVAPATEVALPAIPESGPMYAEPRDLADCAGLVLGSPVRFGSMAAPLKVFFDQTSAMWISGALAGKPGGVFTSGQAMHGGQESTLLSMMLPLLHHGMVVAGVPFTEKAINDTRSGGTPYGASHVAGRETQPRLSDDERAVAQALGRRIARLALAIGGAGPI